MTVRNTKRLIGGVMALLVLVAVLNLVLVWWKPARHVDYFEVVMPLFMVVVFAGTWRRLSAIEAEHGPDYVQPAPPGARKVLIAVALVALVLGAIAGYLAVTHR